MPGFRIRDGREEPEARQGQERIGTTPFDYIHYFISGSCFSLSPLKAVYHSLQMWCKVATFEEYAAGITSST